MLTDVLTLITQTTTIDEYGDRSIVETERTVFCEPMSVGEKEFYQAAAVGLQPEIKFLLTDYLDYEGELYARHNGHRYRVLRTFRKGQNLEITCTAEVNPSFALEDGR